MPNEDLWGLILAGGTGTRLGGDKPFKELAGYRFIDLALEALRQVCSKIIISTNSHDVLAYANLPCLVLADRWSGQGPLAALATAFLDSPAQGLLAIGVDMPLVRVELLKALAQGHGRDKALIPIGPRWPEPLLAYYSRACLPIVMQLLIEGERRPRIVLKTVGSAFLSREEVLALDPNDLSFLNINSPKDLVRANREAQLCGLFNTLNN